MAKPALVGIGLAMLVGLLTVKVDAVSLNCSAVVYLKTNYAGEHFKMSLAPEGETDKEVILDLDAIPKPTTYRNWDDALNSIRFWCNCTAASASSCTGDYDKMKFRVFAEPWWRKNGGGDFFDVNCTAAATPAPASSSCSGSMPVMPPKWGSRASALAILYNLPNYQLPKKAPAPPPGSVNPSPSPSPSPVPSPSPSPSPSPTPSPSSDVSPAPKAKPPPRKKPPPSPPPKSKRVRHM